MIQCHCGYFCADVTAFVDEERNIYQVTGICKRHGKVDLTDMNWCWEDFFPEEEIEHD